MKKTLMVLMVVTLISAGLSNALPAAASTLPEPEYVQSMQRLMDLGVFSLTEPDKMDLEQAVTREQLATVIILLNGHEDKTSLYRNASLFPMSPRQDGLPDMWGLRLNWAICVQNPTDCSILKRR